MKRLFSAFVFVLLVLALCSCAEKKETFETGVTTVYVMDTFADIELYPQNEEVTEKITDALYDLESELSATDGKVAELNKSGKCDGATAYINSLLSQSETYYKETNGAFSPYLGALVELWGIGSKNYVPTEKEISEALSVSKAENVESNGKDFVGLRDGVRLNFGAVAKGYATDIIKEILTEEEIPGAIVSIGGNVYVHGTKPSGELFSVALRDPEGEQNDWVLSLPLTNKFVISSGDYERYFEKDGVRYHHIFSPETGYPAESDLKTVCVVSEDGAMADAYSTALFVMGKEKALSFWREHEGFELILIGQDNKITLTEGLDGLVSPNTEKDYTYEVEKR